ncbi:MAG: crotonase/enoyl-CoA hydratase family protein [Myxococcales bacterium]|nr:crotonase/enoyl-CoA hydratase family protein [Myxococcales bacterium]
MEERVRVEMKDGIADVRMVRGNKLNALDPPMFAALVETANALADDLSLRAVVLSGEGRAFCAGLDMATMSRVGDTLGKPASAQNRSAADADPRRNPAWVWQLLPVPVIAAVHGVAYGAGLQIAMGADIRIVAPDARLSIRESHWGLVPDVGLTQTFRNLVGVDIAKELTFTGRVISGSEAREFRLATHVSEDPHGDAMALAREIAGRSPDAVRASKKLWNEALFGSVEEGLALERKIQRTLAGRPNQVEAVRAGLEKRAPNFSDPE